MQQGRNTLRIPDFRDEGIVQSGPKDPGTTVPPPPPIRLRPVLADGVEVVRLMSLHCTEVFDNGVLAIAMTLLVLDLSVSRYREHRMASAATGAGGSQVPAADLPQHQRSSANPGSCCDPPLSKAYDGSVGYAPARLREIAGFRKSAEQAAERGRQTDSM